MQTNFKKLIPTIFAIVAILNTHSVVPVKTKKPILVLSAMSKELEPILSQLSQPKLHSYKHIPYYTAKLNNQKIILALTGIGEVNAGSITSLLANHFHPKVVFLSGVAGGLQPNLPIGSIVIATKTVDAQHNTPHTIKSQSKLNTSQTITQTMPLIFKLDSKLINQIKKNKTLSNMNINFGPTATDVIFNPDDNNDRLLEKNHILAVDMEDYAVAKACWLYHSPLIIIRAMSDNVANKIPYTQRNTKIAAMKAANLTILSIKALSE